MRPVSINFDQLSRRRKVGNHKRNTRLALILVGVTTILLFITLTPIGEAKSKPSLESRIEALEKSHRFSLELYRAVAEVMERKGLIESSGELVDHARKNTTPYGYDVSAVISNLRALSAAQLVFKFDQKKRFGSVEELLQESLIDAGFKGLGTEGGLTRGDMRYRMTVSKDGSLYVVSVIQPNGAGRAFAMTSDGVIFVHPKQVKFYSDLESLPAAKDYRWKELDQFTDW
ncbi:hypothetical protein JYT83_00415 [bacterium AH-315-F18]|nr:hypothetical protein [bacterium AH-315-F18]